MTRAERDKGALLVEEMLFRKQTELMGLRRASSALPRNSDAAATLRALDEFLREDVDELQAICEALGCSEKEVDDGVSQAAD